VGDVSGKPGRKRKEWGILLSQRGDRLSQPIRVMGGKEFNAKNLVGVGVQEVEGKKKLTGKRKGGEETVSGKGEKGRVKSTGHLPWSEHGMEGLPGGNGFKRPDRQSKGQERELR